MSGDMERDRDRDRDSDKETGKNKQSGALGLVAVMKSARQE
jgi:hypothetical protein